jgi:hypothetical protein
MNTTLQTLTTTAYIADLSGVWAALVKGYIGPAIIIIVGAMSVMYLVKHQIRPFVVYLALAIIVAITIYAAPALLGQQSTLVRNGGEIVKQVN